MLLASQLPALIVLLVLGTVAKVSTVRSGGEMGTLARLGPAVSRFRCCSSARSVSW